MATLNVLILTYNHAPFIARCIEGILEQKSNHDIKINIFEDCSTDGTQEIVRRYAEQYPDKITAVLNPVNLGKRKGIQKQVDRGFRSLKGDYIALLEGDDYWSDESKVQLQIDALEQSSSFIVSSHNCVKIYENNDKLSDIFAYDVDRKPIYTVHDLVWMKKVFHISTLIFKNVDPDRISASFRYVRNKWCCEIYFNMLFAQHGYIVYLDRDMSVYRIHSGGNFSGMSEVESRVFNIEGLLRYNWWLRFRFMKGFSFSIYRLTHELVNLWDMGKLPLLPPLQRFKYRLISGVAAKIYDFIDDHPEADPAVWWHGEKPKGSEPRLVLISGYDRALGIAP